MANKLDPSQQFIYVRTYARWREDLGRREISWENETVPRVMKFLRETRAMEVNEVIFQKIEKYMKRMEVMPSMRLVWAAGESAKRDNTELYNCSAMHMNSIESFSEMLYILMCGTGVGYGVQAVQVEKLPIIPVLTVGLEGTHIIEDSTAGWADSVKVLISQLYSGTDIKMDYSGIRLKGARLRTKGGRASGPDPLKELHRYIREVFYIAQGRQLTPLEVSDICNVIAEIVVVGGVRRSSQICLSDLDSEEMRNAKMFPFPPKRYMANFSAVYEKKPSAAIFLREWASLVASGSGERGIFNLGSIRKNAPLRREKSLIELTNPCFHKDTLITTRNGLFKIKELVGKEVDIWNGTTWQTINNFRKTGENQEILQITLRDGSLIHVTPNHTMILDNGEKVFAKNLEVGVSLKRGNTEIVGTHSEKGAYLKGFLLGDGTTTKGRALLWLYDTKYMCQERLIQSALEITPTKVNTNGILVPSFVDAGSNRKKMQGLSCRSELALWAGLWKQQLPDEVYNWDQTTKYEFIAGVMDADGSVCDSKKGFNYQLSSIHKQFLLDFQTLLKTLGVLSTLSKARHQGVTDFNDGYGVYNIQPLYRLTISQTGAIRLAKKVTFSRLKSFADRGVKYNLAPTFNKIASIEYSDKADEVFCCTVEGNHTLSISNGILVGQCGEINLRHRQFCNLSEVVIKADDSLSDLMEKVKVAVWIGCIQSTYTYFPYLSPEWQKNCEEEHLLGVSITGQMDNLNILTDTTLRELKRKTYEVAKNAARIIGMPIPTAITCVKPSGTVSQLVNSASGLHTRFAPYYIRRYRISAMDPLCKLMQAQRVPLKIENGQTEEDWEAEIKARDKGKPHGHHSTIYKEGEKWSLDKVNTFVVEFPIASPFGAKTRKDLNALEQLEHYKMVQTYWCEHNASNTIYVKDHEWTEVGNWVYKNWDSVGGLSFLPYEGGKYRLAPYEEISEYEYNIRKGDFTEIDYSLLSKFEEEDSTEGSQTLACVGDKCELN
jgi:hypothetical protein